VIICQFGGAIKLVSRTDFAVSFMNNLCRIYNNIEYIPHHLQRDPLAREARLVSFDAALEELQAALSYCKDLCTKREVVLGRKTQGPEGTPVERTVAGGLITVRGLKAVREMFTAEKRKHLWIKAFTNGSPVEHAFGERRTEGQSRHPTMREYGGKKGRSDIEKIKKNLPNPFLLSYKSIAGLSGTPASSDPCIRDSSTFTSAKRPGQARRQN
jgi:hypothetical protein